MSVELVQLYNLSSSTVLGPDLLGPIDEDPVQHLVPCPKLFFGQSEHLPSTAFRFRSSQLFLQRSAAEHFTDYHRDPLSDYHLV